MDSISPTQSNPTSSANTQRSYQWWRVIVWFVCAAIVLYISGFIPLQGGEMYDSGLQGAGCSCTSHYVGFPFPYEHIGVEIERSATSMIPTAYAQVNIEGAEPACLPPCYGLLGRNVMLQILNGIIYFLIFLSIDLLVFNKRNKKIYLLLLPIFAVLMLVGMILPVESLVTDMGRL